MSRQNLPWGRLALALAASLVLAAAGYGLLRRSSAAAYHGQYEAESGVIYGSASLTSDSAASGQSAVLFGTAMSLSTPSKKRLALQLVSSAENSTLDWQSQFKYIEDIGDGRGYTAGIIGFCSGTGDMLELVQYYTKIKPGNNLAKYLPALQKVNGTASHTGLGAAFEADWRAAAADSSFQLAQEAERDRVYFDPAVALARADGLRPLGQFIYYDAAVMHGADAWGGGLPDIRARTVKKAKPPSQGGDETTYLNAFLDERKAEMLKEEAHQDVSRVEMAQRKFLKERNFNLAVPLTWSVYGDNYTITKES